jgi:hypothetical protein
MVSDILGLGEAIGTIADEVSEVIDSMDRPIHEVTEEYKIGRKKVTKRWSLSKLDIILFITIGVVGAMVLITILTAIDIQNKAGLSEEVKGFGPFEWGENVAKREGLTKEEWVKKYGGK